MYCKIRLTKQDLESMDLNATFSIFERNLSNQVIQKALIKFPRNIYGLFNYLFSYMDSCPAQQPMLFNELNLQVYEESFFY
jgi:hypothetical protein